MHKIITMPLSHFHLLRLQKTAFTDCKWCITCTLEALLCWICTPNIFHIPLRTFEHEMTSFLRGQMYAVVLVQKLQCAKKPTHRTVIVLHIGDIKLHNLWTSANSAGPDHISSMWNKKRKFNATVNVNMATYSPYFWQWAVVVPSKVVHLCLVWVTAMHFLYIKQVGELTYRPIPTPPSLYDMVHSPALRSIFWISINNWS